MYNKNKRGVSEITSFVFLTLLVVVVSLSAYFILKNVLQDNIQTFDRNGAENFLKKFSQKSTQIQSFDNNTATMEFTFSNGNLVFNNNQLSYQSLVKYDENKTNCFSSICYFAVNGFEKIYYNLSNNYNFESNLTLVPGDYILILTNLKNGAKIRVQIK